MESLLFLLAQEGGAAAAAQADLPPPKEDQIAESFMDLIMNPERLSDMAIDVGKNLVIALLIFVIGKWVAGVIANILKKGLRSANFEETLVGFFGNIIHAILIVVVAIAALNQIGVDTSSLTAVVAAAGLAIGFALQGSLGNFAAGVLMIFFKPIKVGDLVTAAGVFGVVREIELFATVIDTPDGKKVIVPNSGITGANIENLTANGTIRIDMTFGISYGDDIDKAKRIMLECLTAQDLVLKSPEPNVAMVEHGDSSVNFVVRPWVKPTDYWPVWFATHEAIKKAFDAQGVEIPFPQRDVHLDPAG